MNLPKFQIPEKSIPLFRDWRKYNYAVLVGGRGSAKSETVARYVIMRCMSAKIKVLCVRESQNSMAESVHSLLSAIIIQYELTDFFEIQRDKIICKISGSTIIFKGLRQEAGHVRSMHDIDLVWIEEGQYVGSPGFISLDDTIRKDGSLIIMVLNPRNPDDHIYANFVAIERPDTLVIKLNIMDNPFATKVQRQKAERLFRTNPELYKHVYLGGFDNFGGTIGAFQQIEKFTAEYLVAFIDTSFSDSKDSDRTSVSIVGFSIDSNNPDTEICPIEFTGMSWQKSITDDNVIRELLYFLDRFQPIETCVESQLSDSTKIFIEKFRNVELELNLQVKNHWTVFHQTKNKHERIMQLVAMNKDRMKVISGTEKAYLNPIIYYTKKADHDDEIDSLAGAINLWLTSKNLHEYIYNYEALKKQRAV